MLIGPPGTGKSQTIANIIANTLAQGRSVLFVAEKRAALEVVQRRLKQVGLADFCLDLFSSKVSKTAVLGQLERAQAAHESAADGGWTTAKADLATLRAELNGYVRDLHAPGRNGWTPFRAIGAVMRAADGAVPEVRLSWPHSEFHDAGDWQRLVEAVEEASEVLRRAGTAMREPTLAGIERADWSPVWQGRLLDQARAAVVRLGALENAVEAATAVLQLRSYPRARDRLQRLVELSGLVVDPIGSDAAWALAEGAADVRDGMQAAAERVARYKEVQRALTGSWRPSVTGLPLGTLRAEWRNAAEKWVLPRSLAQRAVRKRLAEQADGPLPEECGPELDRLAELAEIEAALRAMPEAAVLGRAWRGLDTNFARIEAAYAWAQQLRRASASCATDPAALIGLRTHLGLLVGEGVDLLAPGGPVGAALGALARAWGELAAGMDELSALAGGPVSGIVDEDKADWLPALGEKLSGWSAASRLIQEWCAWRGVAQAAEALGLRPLIQALEEELVAPDDVLRALEANYARWWIDLVVDAAPRLRGFVAARHETRIERFRALDVRLQALSSQVVRTCITAGIPGAVLRQVDPEYAVLTRELAKKTRHLPVRQLAQRMPKALRRLTPCLMMSPLSVAQYLPAEAEPFDLVIFDEASQIFVQDAVGALLRGKQAIIAGDTKQLPPTSFFLNLQDDGEAEDEDEDGPPSAGEFESVLKAADALAIEQSPHFALHPLRWHYRSRHESLIAFSRRHFYDSLITFPSVSQESAVTLEYVADGVYRGGKGGKRDNPVEAARVADLVIAQVRSEPDLSVGVITFSETHQQAVQAEIDARRRDDPLLEALLSGEGSEGFFVKNIENVQGDERDVIFLSIGYGRDPQGNLYMRFGPLNADGGDRRLNVAVTRARHRCTVVSSLLPQDITSDRTGPRLLRAYLELAQGGGASAEALLGAATLPPGDFERAVLGALTVLGHEVRRQVGLFDYRMDLAVVDPDDPDRFLLGIECDGAMYRDAETARARDRLRPDVLRGLGWRLVRLWSGDWVRDPDGELARLEDAIARARRGEDVAPARQELPADSEGEGTEKGKGAEAEDAAPVPRSFTGLPPGVAFYERVILSLPGAAEALYDEDGARRAQFLRRLVDAEGPLALEAAVQRLADAAGITRAGSRVRGLIEETVEELASTEAVDLRGDFLWPRGCDRPAPRVPRERDLPRPVEQVCREEIGELVVALLKVAFGMRRDELITETARLLGYRSAGVNIRDRVNDALSLLELDNRIHVQGGQVRALELD